MPKRTENCRPKPIKDNRNRLIVYVDKKRTVFGKYNDPAAWEEYNAFCESRQNRGSEASKPVSVAPPNKALDVPHCSPGNFPSVAVLVAEFLDYAVNAKNPGDYRTYRIACKALLQYSNVTTEQFDAYLLLKLQDGFVRADYVRKYCNKLVNFCIGIFRWGEPRRLCPPGKSGQLRAVEPLRYGTPRESEPRDAVPSPSTSLF